MKIKLYYEDGFISNWMTDNQLRHWLTMNDTNAKNIVAVEIQEKMTKEQAEELLKKYKS